MPWASTASTSCGLEAGVGQRLADHPLLGGAVGGGEAVGGAVLVDGRAADHGEDRVAVALGVGEALQDEHADALGPAGAVGRLGEGLAAAVGGEAALAAELDEDAGRREHGDAAGQGQRALAPAQRLAARCIATSEEEQAVSTVIAGPSRPRV